MIKKIKKKTRFYHYQIQKLYFLLLELKVRIKQGANILVLDDDAVILKKQKQLIIILN